MKIKKITTLLAEKLNRNIFRISALFRRLTRNKVDMKYYADMLTMKINRLIRNEYIPNPREHLYVEVSNICNLRCKFCGYSKSLNNKKLTMSNELFFDIINRATNFGYDTFGLTPIVGEVFVDKNFIDKTKFLEAHPKVKNYSFFTNFTLVSKQDIDDLIQSKKIKELFISLYGHDLNSFILITRGNRETYQKLLSNLDYLLSKCNKIKFKLSFGLRTDRSFIGLQKCDSDLCKILRNIIKITNSNIQILKSFNTWGGLITSEDVKGLDMIINDPTKFYKNGACSLIFYKNQVMADGTINACACRDINATLRIGDIKTQTFDEIYSINNKNFLKLIANQQKGHFNPICKKCDFYRSVYKNYEVYEKYLKKPISISDFFHYLKN
ncbi:MAG: radical SAM protein [Promethearchaeota archaeon]